MRRILVSFGLVSCLLAATAQAEEHGVAPKPVPEPQVFETVHDGQFGGKALRYKVIAGETYLKNGAGAPAASMFSTSYIVETKERARPVTFVFNGGPGSSSVWLHMGVYGPKRVITASDADSDDGAAPYKLVDNKDAILDLTDLVFIDPIGTGYSRVIGEGKGEDYWSQTGDTASIAEFMRQWVTKHKRWNAKKYIAGESFGTTRAAELAYALTTGDVDMALNGLIMISQALDYEGSTPVHDNLYAYVAFLPTLAASAHYHGKTPDAPKDLAVFMEEARAFARDVYAPALLKGAMLKGAERTAIIDRLAYFTGLSKTYIDRSDLRILTGRFTKELLRDKGVAIGRVDARYLGDEADDVAERPAADPGGYAYGSAYSALIQHYFTADLGTDFDRPYLMSSGKVGDNWIYRETPKGESYEPSYVNVARRLGVAMRRNKDLKVWVANGYYDLITPFFDAEITFARHGIPQENVVMTYYRAGHMMYVHEPSFKALVRDTRAFYAGELKGE